MTLPPGHFARTRLIPLPVFSWYHIPVLATIIQTKETQFSNPFFQLQLMPEAHQGTDDLAG